MIVDSFSMHADFSLLHLSWPNIFNITVGNSNVRKYWTNSCIFLGTILTVQHQGLTLYPQAPNTFSKVAQTNATRLALCHSKTSMLSG